MLLFPKKCEGEHTIEVATQKIRCRYVNFMWWCAKCVATPSKLTGNVIRSNTCDLTSVSSNIFDLTSVTRMYERILT